MRTRLVLALAALAAFGGLGWALLGPDGGGDPGYVAEHPVAAPQTSRVVTVFAEMPPPSPAARVLSTRLERGELPSVPTNAVVMTDTDCAPDAQMISHCRNEVRLADGSRLVLRHPHDMRKIPCLAPGEQIKLVPAV